MPKYVDPGRFELGTTLSWPIWSIVYFPAKLGLKIDSFLTLMGTNLIPDPYSWIMDSCFTPGLYWLIWLWTSIVIGQSYLVLFRKPFYFIITGLVFKEPFNCGLQKETELNCLSYEKNRLFIFSWCFAYEGRDKWIYIKLVLPVSRFYESSCSNRISYIWNTSRLPFCIVVQFHYANL